MHDKVLDPTAMKGVARRVFRRSFFLETLWNYAKMQNVGFVLCIYPALDRLYSNEQDRKQAILRHLDQVNTHPCMGPLLVGLVARLERDLESSTVIPYRRRIMSALAAHGDRFFWTHLKPLAAVWGVFLVVLTYGSVAGSVVLLTIYNGPQLLLRARGFHRGWSEGLKVLEILKSPEMNAAILGMRALLSLGLGLVAGIVVLAAAKAPSTATGIVIPLLLGLGLMVIAAVALLVLRRGVSFTAILYLAAIAVISMFMWFETGIVLG